MTDSPDEYGELLRRALSAEANSVVPSPDGLEIIRARIERRGLRGLMWWRAGASVAGAVLVAATIVMVVPQLRNEMTEQVRSGEVKYTVSNTPEMAATSRGPQRNDVQPPVSARPDVTSPAPEPTTSRSASQSPKPSPKPSRSPKPSPSPTCATPPSNGTTVEPEGLARGCEETETPAPTPAETGGPSDTPCAVNDCPTTVDQRTPVPAEPPTPAPTTP
ncbi:hypothetical protein [Streptosporangium sp. NPDC051022]|uniref:hypothetical protein n=1 Tax=Streptosporangium sp. NPDC051022 TaxID=3155752 RepID=UPI00342DDAB6